MGAKEKELAEQITARLEALTREKKALDPGRSIKHNRYTDDDKAAALAHLQSNGGGVVQTARDMHVPLSTLKAWASGRRLPPAVLEKYGIVRDKLTTRLEDIAHQILDELPEKIESASLKDLGATLAVVIDKMRLLREEPTAITEISRSPREMLESLIERTMQWHPDMTREEVIEAIRDVRPEAAKFLK